MSEYTITGNDPVQHVLKDLGPTWPVEGLSLTALEGQWSHQSCFSSRVSVSMSVWLMRMSGWNWNTAVAHGFHFAWSLPAPHQTNHPLPTVNTVHNRALTSQREIGIQIECMIFRSSNPCVVLCWQPDAVSEGGVSCRHGKRQESCFNP